MKKLATLAMASAILIATAILPTCGGLCCPRSSEATMHAEMPCCEPGVSMTPREAVRLQPATFFTLSHATVPVVITKTDPAPRPAHVRSASVEHHEPAPPLFLRNAQLLI